MALNALGRLEVVFTFNDQSKKGTGSAKQNIQGLSTTAQQEGKKMQNAFSGAFPALLTVGLLRQMGGAIGAFIQPARELQTSLREMAAFSGQTDEQFQSFTQNTMPLVERLSLLTAKSVPELTRAMTELQKKGILDTMDAFRALVPSAALAVVAGEDVATTAEAASVVYSVLGESGKQLSFRMDQMAIAAASSKLNFNELADVVARTGQAVAIADPIFADMLFMLAKTRDMGASAAISATQVRRAYEQFAKKQGEIAGVLGVSTETVGGKLRDFSDMMVEVVDRGDDLKTVMIGLNKTLGTRAFAPMAGIVLAMSKAQKEAAETGQDWHDVFFKLKHELNDAEGKVAELFTTVTRDNPEVAFARLSIAFEQFAAAGGGAIMVSLVGVADKLTSLVIFARDAITVFTDFKDGFLNAIPGLSAFSGILGEVLTATTMAIAIFAMARASWMLFGNVVQFAMGPLFGSVGIMNATSGAARFNAQSLSLAALKTRALSAAQRVMAGTSAAAQTALAGLTAGTFSFGGALTFVGRAAVFLSRVMGPLSLIIGAVSLLMTAFDGFDDNIQDLNKAVMEGQKGKVADDIRKAADHFGNKIADAAKRWDDMFKEKPAVLNEKTFSKVEGQIGKLLADVNPEARRKIGPALQAETAGLVESFKAIRASALAGEEVDPQMVLTFGNQIGVVSSMLQKHGLAGSEASAKMADELHEAQQAIMNFTEATESRVKMLDKLTIDSGQGDVFAETTSKGKSIQEAIEKQADPANSAIKAGFMPKRVSHKKEFDPGIFGKLPDTASGPVQPTQQQLDKSPDLKADLRRIEMAIERQTGAMRQGMPVSVSPGSGLDNAVRESRSHSSENSLNPMSGR